MARVHQNRYPSNFFPPIDLLASPQVKRSTAVPTSRVCYELVESVPIHGHAREEREEGAHHEEPRGEADALVQRHDEDVDDVGREGQEGEGEDHVPDVGGHVGAHPVGMKIGLQNPSLP